MVSADPPRSRPRVIIVAHSLDAADGGMETVHVELLERQLDRVDVVAVTMRLDPRLHGRVRFEPIKVPSRPAPVRFVLFYLLASIRVWRLRRPGDVVHTCGAIIANRVGVATVHTVSAAIVAARGGRLTSRGAPLARRVNSGALRALALIAERWTYRPGRVDALCAVSSTTARELSESYPGVSIVITPNGVDTERFAPDPAVRASMRRDLGLGDHIVALFVGGDFERKGLAVAIEALCAAPSVTLVVAGSGDLDRARGVARAFGVNDRVHLLGQRSDVERLAQMADIYVCASLYEADSLALLEGAAAGLALVSTPVGSAPTVIGEPPQSSGLLVDRSPAALGAALEELANDPDARERCGAQARLVALGRSWDTVADQVLELYRTIS